MGFFLTLALWAVFFLLSSVLKPRNNQDQQRPAGVNDFSFPTATEGRPVPLVWGTVLVKGPNLIWYGDFKVKPVTEKIRTGLFSKTTVTKGYRYYVGMDFAICRGSLDELKNIIIKETSAWTGVLTSDGSSGSIVNENFFGPQNGMSGTFKFYRGSNTQAADPYLSSKFNIAGFTPAYRGTSHVVWEGGYIGSSTSIPAWSFEVKRVPNGLELVDETISNDDANIMNVLYEVMTNTEWGLGFPAEDIDADNFREAADVLATELNGFSLCLDREMNVRDFIRMLEQQADGQVYMDQETGKWKMNLVRGGYDLNDAPLIDESNTISIENFTRGSWDETANEIILQYNSRDLVYNDSYVRAQDLANVRLQGNRIVSESVSFPGVRNAALANSLVWRTLRTRCFPLAKAQVSVNRTLYGIKPAGVIRLTNEKLGLVNMPMRVTKIDYGSLSDNKIVLELVQDVFAFDDPAFANPEPGVWELPTTEVAAVPANRSIFLEAPKAFCDRAAILPGTYGRIWGAAIQTSGSAIGVEAHASIGSGYSRSFSLPLFSLGAHLSTSLGQSGTQGSISIILDCDIDSAADWVAAFNENASDVEVGANLINLVYIGGEFFLFKNISAGPGANQVTLSDGYRGALDSTPKAHTTAEVVWFVQSNLSDGAFDDSDSVNGKFLPFSVSETLDISAATVLGPVDMDNRALKPYPPTNLNLGAGVFSGSSISLDGTSVGSGIDQLGVRAAFTRRDYRVANEAFAVVDESTLPGDFPTANTTQYRLTVRRSVADGGALVVQSTWNSGGATLDISRTAILRNIASGTVPSALEFRVETRHVVSATTYNAQEDTSLSVPVTSELSSLFKFGVLNTSAVSSSWSSDFTGTLTISVGTAPGVGNNVQCRINGGSWVNVVSGTNTSGTIAVTSGQTVEIRHDRSTAYETTVIASNGSAKKGYGILYA